MKFLLCNFKNSNLDYLKKHYIDFHQVDSENHFFRKLFEEGQSNVFHGKKCIRCKEFLPTVKSKRYHDFIKHYELGKDAIQSENKPVSIITVGPIKIYEIRFEQHSADYDFFNSEEVVDDFLFKVKNRIVRSDRDFIIRCGFSLQNIQPSPEGFDQPLKSSRYWSTDPIQTKSFNDYVLFTLRSPILKRAINNGLSGSSWRFERFNYINIKLTSEPIDNLVW